MLSWARTCINISVHFGTITSKINKQPYTKLGGSPYIQRTYRLTCLLSDSADYSSTAVCTANNKPYYKVNQVLVYSSCKGKALLLELLSLYAV